MHRPQALSSDDIKFIQDHQKDNVSDLLLKYHHQPDKKYLIYQIEARQRLRKKLPSWLENDQVQFPTGLPLEQCSSEITASLKAQLITGEHLSDLTGGLGVDTYYLSQSFKRSSYLESSPEYAEYARHNFSILGANIGVNQGDATKEIIATTADFIYLDPHRRDEDQNKRFMLSDYSPNVLNMLEYLSQPGRKSLIKTSPMLDIKAALSQLKKVSEVWVISVANDCKEVLYLIEVNTSNTILLRTFNWSAGQWQNFEAPLNGTANISLGPVQAFLYEPNASILKADLQNSVAESFQLAKLHPNSQLFTSDIQHLDYPGKVFAVIESLRPWAKSLQGKRFNVISRNFPAKASAIEQRLKLIPARHDYLIATRNFKEKKLFLKCRLINSVK